MVSVRSTWYTLLVSLVMLGMLACCYQLLTLLIARPASFIAYLRQFDDLILSAFEIKVPVLKRKWFSYLVLMAKRGLVTWLTRTLILFGLTLSEHCFGFCCPLSQKEGPLTDLLQVGTEIVLLNLGLISHIFRVWKLSRIFSLFYCSFCKVNNTILLMYIF